LFFYAGHGLQVAGQNYLVPIDAQAETAAALDFEMVRLDLVHRTMEREAQTNIIFLDACRNNPLTRNLARALGTRSTQIGRGLAVVESGVGTLISFSTSPGNVASDGAGRNSPFAGALVRRLSASTDDLSAILIEVRNDVMNETKGNQIPWEHSALRGRFYFDADPKSATPAAVAPTWRLSEAAEVWDRAKETSNVRVLEAFIARYKDTFYAELARARIEELKGQPANLSAGPSDHDAKCSAITRSKDAQRTCIAEPNCAWNSTWSFCYGTGAAASEPTERDVLWTRLRIRVSPVGRFVRMVAPNSAAARAGIAVDDVIIGINKQLVRDDIEQIVVALPRFAKVEITVTREGKPFTVDVQLDESR